MITMSESDVNSNIPDAANQLGQEKSDVENATPTPSSACVLEEFDKPLVSPLDKRTSGMSSSLPSLSSFASLGGDGGEDSVAYSSEEDLEGYDYEEDDDESYASSPKAETRSMPAIPGLEVSKDARPGKFLAELTISADSLVNKNTPEKELGARWKDGSIPIAVLMKQKKEHKDVLQDQNKEEQNKEKKEERKGRGRRNSGRRRLRSKSPPPPTGGRNEGLSDENSSDDDINFSVVPPARPVRQVSSGELPPVSPGPGGGMFSPLGAFASMPIKPERKVSMNHVSSNMVLSTDPLITPEPASFGDKSIQPVVGKSLPSIDLSHQDTTESPTSLPPLKPMRQTTRNLFDGFVETITEDGANSEDSTNTDEDEDVEPQANDNIPSQPQRRETFHVDTTPLPSQPQRRETFYDDTNPLQAVEESFGADANPDADETPSAPQRQVTMDGSFSLGERRLSTKRWSLIEDDE